MNYLADWAVGTLLAGIAIVHWFALKRMMAVSGRFTALVNRLREGPPPPEPKMAEPELVAALAAATREEFGANASGMPEVSSGKMPVSTPQSPSTHIIFLAALLVGGFASRVFFGDASNTLTTALRSEGFTRLFGDGPLAWMVLLLGGMLVGFGTRMAGGCTSGHGLCGVSRFQPGSIVATFGFFGAGIVISFLLGSLT